MKNVYKGFITIWIVLTCLFMSGCQNNDRILMSEDSEVAVTTEYSDNETEEHETSFEKQIDTSEDLIYVYVCGHVKEPGVYSLKSSSRVCDAISMAGGILEDGNMIALNQAEKMTDGMTIYVPGLEEEYESVPGNVQEEDGLVNINTASKEMLMTVPGIGESKADAIIAYRDEHGTFNSLEDLMNISGIKEGVFNKIKDHLKVVN